MTTEYINNLPAIITEETTKYSPKNNQGDPLHTFPIEKMIENSSGEFLITEFEYPQDSSLDYNQQAATDGMIAKNIVGIPIRTTSKNGIEVLSDNHTVYNPISGPESNIMILPKYVFAKKGELPLLPNAEDRKITYNRYDGFGNLSQYTLENGTPVCIIWGYGGQYPIAKVEGVDWSVIAAQAEQLETESNLTESSFNALRTVVDSVNNHAMLTCYLYEPLVGVTTIIQPNGQLEIYEYDDAGRLESVKDHNGKVIKQMEYHYKN